MANETLNGTPLELTADGITQEVDCRRGRGYSVDAGGIFTGGSWKIERLVNGEWLPFLDAEEAVRSIAAVGGGFEFNSGAASKLRGVLTGFLGGPVAWIVFFEVGAD